MEKRLKYAGIGSRKTPESILNVMTNIAKKLDPKYILRSGGADGADLAFELGSTNKEIFLPWDNFNKNDSELVFKHFPIHIKESAWELVQKFHPAPQKLSYSARTLHSRNMCQILGEHLDDPSDFVICWTDNGKPKGGTGTAIKCAEYHRIPVYNLYNVEDTAILGQILNIDIDEVIGLGKFY